MAQDKFKTVTNETPKSVVDSMLKPTAELHLLIGGPYTLNGEEHRYGHTALRVKTTSADKTYDFGRYGRITGTFNDSGEGILRVWSEFSSYIRAENLLKRQTTIFTYVVFDSQAEAVTAEFARMIKTGKPRTELELGRSIKVFQLLRPYTALGNNCTTLSVDGIKAGRRRLGKIHQA
jgi:hypothetical protein